MVPQMTPTIEMVMGVYALEFICLCSKGDSCIISTGISCIQFDETRIVSGSWDKTIKVNVCLCQGTYMYDLNVF